MKKMKRGSGHRHKRLPSSSTVAERLAKPLASVRGSTLASGSRRGMA